MPLYRKKPIVVEAEQWYPSKVIPGVRRITACRVDLTKTRGILVDRPDRYVCDTFDGAIDLTPGDWVVYSSIIEGRYVVREHTFAQTYESAFSVDLPPTRSLAGLIARILK